MSSRIGKKTVSNALARLAVQNVELHGLELSTFLHYTGLLPEELEAAGGRLAAHKHIRMLRYSDQLLPKDISTLFDLRAALDAFPDLIALAGNCRNLEAAVNAFIEYKDIITEIDRIRFTRTAKGFEIDHFDESGIDSSLSPFANFMLLIGVIRHYLAPNQYRLSVELTRPPYPAAASIDARTRSSLQFNRPRNRLTCITEGLTTPYPVYNDLLNDYVRRRLDEQLQTIRENQSFSGRVEAFLLGAMASGDFQIDSDNALQQVCDAYGMSRWTVLRKLKKEGESFKALFVKVRFSEACRMLACTKASIGEISTGLGFASQSSFSRFFKSLHGAPPARYREEKKL